MSQYKGGLSDGSAGSVSIRTRRTHVIDVDVEPIRIDESEDTEFVLTVNGVAISRMSYYRADRLHLIEK